MNANAQKIISNCQYFFPDNEDDCGDFLKAVCGGLGVAMSTGQADDIVAYFRNAANGWEALKDVKDAAGNITTRKEVLAKQRADAGKLVICGLTKTELSDTNGHVSVIISAPLCHSSINDDDYPMAYWGRLNSHGGANKCLSYSFGSDVIDDVTYAAIDLPAAAV